MHKTCMPTVTKYENGFKWTEIYDTFKQRINIFDSQGTRENNHLTLMILDTS